MLSSYKKGIYSHQISRMIGITQKFAWFMMHRIHLAFKDKLHRKLKGTVEADETYVGGKVKGKEVVEHQTKHQYLL